MTEPRTQYATTSDGVSIAYWTLGEGPPVVYPPPTLFSHNQLEWQIPENRRWCERLAQKRMLVRYDGRGSGLSEHGVNDFSLEARLLDLEAVVERLGLQSFDLAAFFAAGPLAIAYAARHPERVARLILWCAFARYSDIEQPALGALSDLASKDWELYSETIAHVALGWSEGEAAHRFALFIRECTTHAEYLAYQDGARAVDVAGLLSQVTAPTLVIHRRQATLVPVGAAQRLTSGIPDARFLLLEGSALAPFLGDIEETAQAIDEFLGEGNAPAAELPRGTATILFTDLVSSTALTQRLGDATAQELVRAHNVIVRDALKSHSGTEIKHTGDGIMASFATASAALECAIAIQCAVAAQAEERPELPLGVHIGLNAGEPVAEERDLFGTAVQLARRICDHAEAGQILVPEGVRHLVAGKGFLFADSGDVVLKGFEDAVRLYEVRWRE